MPTTEQKNAGLLRYMQEIDGEYGRRQERARLGPYGASAEAPPPPTPPLTRAQENAITESTLDMLIKLEKAETDRARALEPDFKKTLAYAALEFHKDIAEAQMAASGSTSAGKVRTWGALAKQSLDTMTEIEKRQNAAITGGAATQRNINTMIADLREVPPDQLDAVALDSQFADSFTTLIAEAPEGEAGVRLARLAAGTGIPPEDLITLAKNALGDLQTPVLDVALERIDEQDQNDIHDYMVARKRLSGAARRIDAQGVGTGSSARKGEALLTDFLSAAGVLGTADPDAYAQLLGFGGVREIPESPNASLAREIMEKRMNFAESEWARRTIPDWIEAVKTLPEFEEYMRSQGMVDAQGNVLLHKKDEAYEQLRKDWKRGRLQEAAPRQRQPRTGGPVRQFLREQVEQLFDRDEDQVRAPTSLPEREEDSPFALPPSYVGDEVAERYGRLPEERAPAADGATGPQETLPPGAFHTGTEGWADYALYQEDTAAGPQSVIRFVHPETGKLVTVTKASDPVSYNAIMEKAFGRPGTATSPGQEGAISAAPDVAGILAQVPESHRAGVEDMIAQNGIDDPLVRQTIESLTGQPLPGPAPEAAPAAAGGVPDFGGLQIPQPTQPGQPAAPAQGESGYLGGLRGEGGGFIGGPLDRNPMGRALRESAQREKGRAWLNANKAQLKVDRFGMAQPPGPDHPLYAEWLGVSDPNRYQRREEMLAEYGADATRRAQEATAQEAEGAVTQEQADAANVVGDRDAMIADQSAFEQTREPTRMAPGPEGHIVGDVPPTTDVIAPEGFRDLPTEADEPRELPSLMVAEPMEVRGDAPKVSRGERTPRSYGQGPQVTLDPEEEIAAKGGELGSRMPGSTEGGMRDLDAEAEADFAAAEKEMEDRLGISEEDVATGSPPAEGGTAPKEEKAAKEPKKEAKEEIPAKAEPQREEPPGATPHRDTSIEPIADPGRTQVQPVTNFEAQAHKITPLRPSAGAAIASQPGMSQAAVDPSVGMDSRGARATKNIQALLQSAKQKEDLQKAPQGTQSVPGRP